MQCMSKPACVPWWAVMALVTVILCCSACGGGGGGKRFDLSGKVTFNGAPVPAGQMIFEPDPAAGNSGPPGHAEIVNGVYDTAKNGKGIVGGPHVIRISGLSGPASSPGIKPLFREYVTKKDLEKKTATADFDVPASAAAGMVISNAPPP